LSKEDLFVASPRFASLGQLVVSFPAPGVRSMARQLSRSAGLTVLGLTLQALSEDLFVVIRRRFAWNASFRE
jgi:hypothetical protein